MNIDIGEKQVKSLARNLHTRFIKTDGGATYSQVLDAVSEGLGYRNWNTLSAILGGEEADKPAEIPAAAPVEISAADRPAICLPCNTYVSWLYRDADNYKIGLDTVLQGTLNEEEKQEIRRCLEGDTYFIPGQIGLCDLQNKFNDGQSYWDPDRDHPWHELTALEDTDMNPTGTMTAADLLAAFRKVRQDGWDQGYTPPFYEEMNERWEAHRKAEAGDE